MIMRSLLLLAFTSVASLHAASTPNVLFMMADDLNNSLGCYGNALVKTPNLDKLAARGVRFEKAACQFPLCGPSRNSMLTGLYPNSSGILTNSQVFRQTIPSHVPMPQAFRLAGYFATRGSCPGPPRCRTRSARTGTMIRDHGRWRSIRRARTG